MRTGGSGACRVGRSRILVQPTFFFGGGGGGGLIPGFTGGGGGGLFPFSPPPPVRGGLDGKLGLSLIGLPQIVGYEDHDENYSY